MGGGKGSRTQAAASHCPSPSLYSILVQIETQMHNDKTWQDLSKDLRVSVLDFFFFFFFKAASKLLNTNNV